MISVCMATFNGEHFIVQQLSSILKQLDSEDEIIISDDNSTDSTLEKIYEFSDPRIKVFINDLVAGVIGNFENALNHASNDLIFLAGQEAIWSDNNV